VSPTHAELAPNSIAAIRLFVLDFYRRQLSELKAATAGEHDMMGCVA